MKIKNKKNIIIVLLSITIVILIIVIFSELSFFYENRIKENLIINSNSKISFNDLTLKNIRVSLSVLDNKYETTIKEGSTVFNVMKKIQQENNNNSKFNFKYKEYLSLGILITEINGVKDTRGKYWIYYVNNIKAGIGVSKYILKEGDIISWKQEESYE